MTDHQKTGLKFHVPTRTNANKKFSFLNLKDSLRNTMLQFELETYTHVFVCTLSNITIYIQMRYPKTTNIICVFSKQIIWVACNIVQTIKIL